MIVYLSILGLLGAIFGSFASALIPRIREKRNMTHERSECPHCNHTLSWYDLIPVISWISTLGKCRYCGVRIPPYHIALEMVMILSFIWIWYFLGGAVPMDHTQWFQLLLWLSGAFVGVVIVFYDILYMEIPDSVVLPYIFLLLAALGVSQFVDWNLFGYFVAFENDFLSSPLINAALGAGAIYTFFMAQILISKGAWLGGGDLRIALFMGMIAGAKIAWLGLFLAYIIGSIIGIGILLVYRRRNIAVPFGPYLIAGLALSFLFFDQIIPWYIGLLNT